MNVKQAIGMAVFLVLVVIAGWLIQIEMNDVDYHKDNGYVSHAASEDNRTLFWTEDMMDWERRASPMYVEGIEIGTGDYVEYEFYGDGDTQCHRWTQPDIDVKGFYSNRACVISEVFTVIPAGQGGADVQCTAENQSACVANQNNNKATPGLGIVGVGMGFLAASLVARRKTSS